MEATETFSTKSARAEDVRQKRPTTIADWRFASRRRVFRGENLRVSCHRALHDARDRDPVPKSKATPMGMSLNERGADTRAPDVTALGDSTDARNTSEEDDAFVRRVNLLEILAEDHPEIPPPPEDAARAWTETRIRAHYDAISASRAPPSVDRVRASEVEDVQKTKLDAKSASTTKTRRPFPERARFPETDEATFKRWFPGYARANERIPTECEDARNDASRDASRSVPVNVRRTPKKPTARVLCWPNAGNGEDVYTNERLRVDGVVRLRKSPLLEWCRTHDVEVYAVQLPGRGGRSGEKPFRCVKEAARETLKIVARRFFMFAETVETAETAETVETANRGDTDAPEETFEEASEVPWMIIGHSVGSWCAFEFAREARSHGFPPPEMAFLSGFPAPDVLSEDRPWRPNASLDDARFKDECSEWGVDKAVFHERVWPSFEPLLRADFTLFDRYAYLETDRGAADDDAADDDAADDAAARSGFNPRSSWTPFPGLETLRGVPFVMTFRGADDSRITRDAVLEWSRFVDAEYAHREIAAAPHLFPLLPEKKTEWFGAIRDAMDARFGGFGKPK